MIESAVVATQVKLPANATAVMAVMVMKGVAVQVAEDAEERVGAATEVVEMVAAVALVAEMVVVVGVEARSQAPPVGRVAAVAMAKALLAMVASVVVAAWEEAALVG